MRKIGQSGLGLLEIVVASVLLGVLGIGAMRMIEGLTNSAKLNGAVAEIASIKMQIHTLLSNSQTCPVVFQDLSGGRAKFDPSVLLPENPTTAQIDAYLLANTLAQLKIGSLTLAKKGEKNGNFFVSSIRLTELDSTLRSDTLVNSIAARKIVASLDLSLALGHLAEASLTRQIRLPILITTNNATGSEKNKILACSVNGGVTDLQGQKIVGMMTYNDGAEGILVPNQPDGWIKFPTSLKDRAKGLPYMGLPFTVTDPNEVFLIMGRGRLAAGGIGTAVGYWVTNARGQVVDSGHWGNAPLDLRQNNGCNPSKPIVCRQFFASGQSYFTGLAAGTYTAWLIGYDGLAGDRLYNYDRQLILLQIR